MASLTLLILLLAATTTTVVITLPSTLGPGPSEFFDHIEILTEPNELILFWKFNETEIIFEVHAKTSGWVVFGLGPDLITAWLNKTTGHFSNRDGKLHTRSYGVYSPLALTRYIQVLN